MKPWTRYVLLHWGRWTVVCGRRGVSTHFHARRAYGVSFATFGSVRP